MILRAVSLFLGCFSLLNFLLGLAVPGFDANIWWIDFRILPGRLPDVALPVVSMSLLAYALLGVPAGRLRWLLGAGLGLLTAAVAQNTAQFYRLLAAGAIQTDFPVPLSLFVLLPMCLILRDVWRGSAGPSLSPLPASRPRPRTRERILALATLALLCIGFPVAQMLCFGFTDYRRPADAVVAFGARAYADGRLSTALHDRTRTAVELYQAGLAPVLIFSGGPGDGAIHETEAMRRFAQQNGVPEAAIIRDEQGLSTQHTVDNTVPLFRERGFARVLAVSQFYHLPRIKLTYLRAGFDVYTIPAPRSELLYGLPWFMLREVAALWVYYLRPLMPASSNPEAGGPGG